MRLLAILRKIVFDPVEQARAKRNIGYSLFGLVLIASAHGIVQWFLGDKLSSLPQDLKDLIENKLFPLVFGLAYTVAVIALVYNAIKFHTSE